MKVVTTSGKVLYDKPGKREGEIVVPDAWGELLLAGGVRYLWGAEEKTDKGVVHSTFVNTLKIDSPEFEDRMWGIAYSEMGKAVFRGEMPVNTLL